MRLTLAHKYRDNEDIDLGEHLVSEKYDGVRAYFDGGWLWSRSGKRIMAPDWWLAEVRQASGEALDGELWIERGAFEKTKACVQSSKNIKEDVWKEVKFMAFDLPLASGDYDKRYRKLENLTIENGRVQVVKHIKVNDKEQLTALFEGVVKGGGEGLMIRKIEDGGYQSKRTKCLLKLKTTK